MSHWKRQQIKRRLCVNQLQNKYYAIVPAAGRSRRMGEHKLLLPWLSPDGRMQTVIDSVLEAWTTSCVDDIVMILREDDEDLAAAGRRWQIKLVSVKDDPPDMKSSVQIGLNYLRKQAEPHDDDGCFIAPADLPNLDASLIDRMASKKESSTDILVPRFGPRNGHPILMRWKLTREISSLGASEGIDVLINRPSQTKKFVNFPSIDYVGDIDTPEEYQRLFRERQGASRR